MGREGKKGLKQRGWGKGKWDEMWEGKGRERKGRGQKRGKEKGGGEAEKLLAVDFHYWHSPSL